MWVTETADAAAGGNPWATTFTDTFRYLYQLGSLARSGVQVITHNTLASSDYGAAGPGHLLPAAELLGGLAMAQADGPLGPRSGTIPLP